MGQFENAGAKLGRLGYTPPMTMKSPGTNAPLHRRTEDALKRKAEFVARLVAEGMTEEDAAERAHAEMRDNGKGDWRRG